MTKVFSAIVRYRRAIVVGAHLALFAISYVVAFALRFDFALPPPESDRVLLTLGWIVALRAIAFGLFHLYEGLWRYASVTDVVGVFKASTVSSAAFVVPALMLSEGFPRSVLILDWVLCIGLTGGLRIASRLTLERGHLLNGKRNGDSTKRKVAVVVGAGNVAEALLREVGRGALPYDVAALVDDDPRMRGRRIHGVRVVGTIEDLPALCTSLGASEVLLAKADAPPAVRRAIVQQCKTAGVRLKSVPGVYELLQGTADVRQLHDVRFEDLLGRSAVGTEPERLSDELSGRRVLVTGGAGSIGSELARQIAAFGPESLVLLDRAESDLYLTYVELRDRFPDITIEPVVGDILDEDRVRQTMARSSIDLVYHAAAYKHVPLMEAQPLEAIKNNVFGTEIVARAAIDSGVSEFVLISTDKAVRPVGVMGMTKRAAEHLIRALAGRGTTFVAVRFGNVLGSNGSVLPLFQRQIATRSPLTITDPEASRYFMLISEAVELVLQAGSLGQDGEVYVLNMGDPIRIGDLAENLVRLSGLEPEVEIPIRITGLRAGERRTEELLVDEHEVRPGPHEKILIVREPSFEAQEFLAGVEALRVLVEARRSEAALEILQGLVCGGMVGVESVGSR